MAETRPLGLAGRIHAGGWRRRPGAALLVSVVVSLAACSDGLFHPTPAGSGPASVSLVLPVFSDGSLDPSADGVAAAFGKVDRVRVLIRSVPQGQTLLDRTVQVRSPEEEVRLRLDVPLDEVEQLATLRVEMRRGVDPLFAGEGELTLSRGRSSQAPVDLDPVPHRVEIVPPPPVFTSLGEALDLVAFVVFATGDVIPGRAPLWSSADPATVEVSPQGRAVARAPGGTTLQASHEGAASASTSAEVRLVAVSLHMTPPALALREGSDATLSVSARDAGGSSFLPDRLDWSSSDSSVASVSGSGIVTALVPGSTTIRAGQDGVVAESLVRVDPRAASIQVSPPTADLPAGATLLLFASVTDPRGAPIDPPGVTWTSTDPSVATASADGEVTGRSAGSTRIRAERDGVWDEAVITVVQTVGAIEVSPSSAILRTQESATFTATVSDGLGNPFPPPAGVIWSIDDPGVAQVDGRGRVLALAAGTTRLRATRDGVAGSAQLTVLDRIPQILDTRALVTTGVEGEVELEFQVDVQTYEQPWILEFLLYESPDGAPVDSVYLYGLEPAAGVTSVTTEPFFTWRVPGLDLPGRFHVQATGINDLGRGPPGQMVAFDAIAAPVWPHASYDGEEEAILLEWYFDPMGRSGYVFELQRREADAGAWVHLMTTDGAELSDSHGGLFGTHDRVTDPEGDWDFRVRACLPSRGVCSSWTDPFPLIQGAIDVSGLPHAESASPGANPPGAAG
jgi:uncharacterized protein YjdB